MRAGQPLNSARRRLRKDQLAQRHGQRCTYCSRPFATLREATLDHIVPVSLYRSWSVVNLTLACVDCNRTKADRLPLSMALLLAWTHGVDLCDALRHTLRSSDPRGAAVHPAEEVDSPDIPPVFTTPEGVFIPTADRASGAHGGSEEQPIGSGGSRVDSGWIHSTSTPVHLASWLLLARLAHARQSAAAPRERCGERREQSPPGQQIHRQSARRAVRVGRLEHQRRTPRLNTCEQPTDRGVSA